MGYPGDQGRSGGWSSEPPPSPFAPGAEPDGRNGRSGQADDSPFAPRPGAFAAQPGEPFSEPFGEGYDEPFRVGGAPPQQPQQGPQGPPGPPPGPYDSPYDSPGELYGATGEGYFAAGAPEGPGGPGGPNDFADFGNAREPYGEKRRTNLPLIIGAAAVAGLLLIGGGFGVSAMLKDDDKPSKGKQAQQSPPPKQGVQKQAPPPPAPLNAKLKSRATDPKPLTLDEVFGKRAFTEKGQKYSRTATSATKDCTKVVTGSALVAALKKSGCTQALRATFARTDGKLIGTVGVFNLKTQAAARAVVKAGAGRENSVQALAGTGASKKIGKGEALGTIGLRGHYVIMTWVQRPDGKAIAAKSQKTVTTFTGNVIVGSGLGPALHTRGMAGKPLKN